MAESVNVKSAILDKKFEHYDYKAIDYVAEGELTITITLAEYRALLKSDAIKEHCITKANADKYEREAENKRLQEEVNALRAKLYNCCNTQKED